MDEFRLNILSVQFHSIAQHCVSSLVGVNSIAYQHTVDSHNNISKSIIEGSQEAWTDLQSRVYDNFTQQKIAKFTILDQFS